MRPDSLAEEGHDRDQEVLDLRQKLAAAAAAAKESIGREAKRQLDAAEERAAATEAEVGWCELNTPSSTTLGSSASN